MSNVINSNPNWTQAPPWAGWWAVDADGRAYWHFIRPMMSDGRWVHFSGCSENWKRKEFDREVIVDDWTQTLREYVLASKPPKITVEPTYWWLDEK